MNLYVQYGIVALAVMVAGWSAWRLLRGRRVLGRGAKATWKSVTCVSSSVRTTRRPCVCN